MTYNAKCSGWDNVIPTMHSNSIIFNKKKFQISYLPICPTFDMSYLNVYPHQKKKKKKKKKKTKKHLCCNLFWVKVKYR